MKHFLLAIVLVCGWVRLSAADPATDLAARGEQLMHDENYAKAAEVCEQFLKEYPTGGPAGPEMVFKVRYNLAWCYYLIADYPKAIKAFQDLAGEKNPSMDLRQQAMQLVGDSYSRYAGSLADAKDKKDNYDKSIDTYTKFLSLFPKSQSLPDVLYGRALAYLRVEKYKEAENDLRDELSQFPVGDLVLDSQYLLATVLGTHGSVLRKAGKADEAAKYLEAARDLFKRIIASNDIALANDAAYAAGEIFIQLKEYDTAISYYRSVSSRDEVVASQQKKVRTIMEALTRALAAGEKTRATELANLHMKEASKLKEIQNSSDLLLEADLRIADCYFQQKKYAESRVMYRFVLDHAKLNDKEIAKNAAAQIVATHIGEFRPAEAKQRLDEFESDYGIDPLAESFGLAIGDLFLRKGKAQDALDALDKGLKEYPNSSLKPMMEFRRAQALDALGKSEEATKQMQQVLQSDVTKEAPAEVEYAFGKMLRNRGNYDEAIKHLSLVVDKYPNFELLDDASFQLALCYKGKKEYDKAIDMLRKFVQSFEGKSPLVVQAAFEIGQCYEAKSDVDNAVKAYGDLVNKYPGDKFAPYAQYQIAIVYYNKEKWEDMVKSFEELIRRFPKDPLVCDAHFWIGYKLQREKNYPKAVEQFDTVVTDCHDNPLASDAENRIGNCWQTAAFAMGNYKAQDKDTQANWKSAVARSVAAYEKLLADYPKSAQVTDGLKALTQLELARIQAGLETPADVDSYFQKLSAQHADDPGLSARVLFCLASVYYTMNKPDDALRIFDKGFQGVGDAVLPAEYYDQYGELLTATKKCDQAENIYLQMQDKFKDDAQTLANAVWGLGNMYLQCGNYEKAAVQFDRLIKEFPWHKHAADAQFGKGLILEAQKKWDEAQKIYEDVAVKLRGDARIRSLLGIGRCQMAKGEYKKAVENFLKVSLFYEKFEEFASEALWLCGQCYEKLSDNPNAIQQYNDLVHKYPNSKYAADARNRLKELAPAK